VCIHSTGFKNCSIVSQGFSASFCRKILFLFLSIHWRLSSFFLNFICPSSHFPFWHGFWRVKHNETTTNTNPEKRWRDILAGEVTLIRDCNLYLGFNMCNSVYLFLFGVIAEYLIDIRVRNVLGGVHIKQISDISLNKGAKNTKIKFNTPPFEGLFFFGHQPKFHMLSGRNTIKNSIFLGCVELRRRTLNVRFRAPSLIISRWLLVVWVLNVNSWMRPSMAGKT
jgi:hypothetical protein